MTRATSLFLDLLRLAAAMVVFAAHTSNYWNLPLQRTMLDRAHDAVIVFFVLSGYVIAYTARPGAGDAKRYAAARLSRLCSVVVPALVFTALLWAFGRELDPGLYAYFDRKYPALRFLASGLFINEVWSLELSPPTNTPFWSLGYEFWYYGFFGVALFVKPRGLKWSALAVSALMAGPKIILLLPVWLIGVAAFRWRDAHNFSRAAAMSGLILSTFATLAMLWWVPDWPAKPGTAPWYFSAGWVSDFVKALGWGGVIWCFNRSWTATDVFVPKGVIRCVRSLAGLTFSLYLLHAPLIVLVTAFFPPITVGPLGIAVLLGAMLLVIGVIGAFSEYSRAYWRRGFETILSARPVRPE